MGEGIVRKTHMDINKVTLVGRLARTPEVRTTTSGQTIATMSLATGHQWKDAKTKEQKKRTDFHHVVLWGGLATIAGKYLDKGSQVYVEGRISHREWTDKTGIKRKSCDIVGSELVFLGSSKKKNAEGSLVKEEPSEKELTVETV